jgi:hypothetical protein
MSQKAGIAAALPRIGTFDSALTLEKPAPSILGGAGGVARRASD